MGTSTRTPVALGIDVGSTNAKVVAVDADGSVVSRVVRPTPRDPVRLTIDAEVLVDAVEDMVVAACGDGLELRAVSVAGVGEDGVLVDAHQAPVTEALAWFDPRRLTVHRSLLERGLDAAAAFDAAGDPVRTFVGWAWAREQAGDASVASWLALTDVVSARWTDRLFLSSTLASRTAAWRSDDGTWDRARVEATLGSVELLPPVVASGEVLGGVASARLAAAGVLHPEAIVVAGGHDHPIAGWGVDLMSPGVVLDSMGTAEVVVTQARGAARPDSDSIDIAPGIRSDGLTLLRVEELARNVQWASQDPEVAGHIRTLLDGSAAFVPVLEEGHFVPGRRGGGQPSYSLGAPHDPRVRASAVLGALAVAGRGAIEAVRAAGAERSEVRVAGGWARSPGWIEIKTAVNGYRAAPVLEPQVTAAGAALLAAEAVGWTPDPVRALGGFTAGMLG
jgi:sugar (pentulose or hexulose) kinase